MSKVTFTLDSLWATMGSFIPGADTRVNFYGQQNKHGRAVLNGMLRHYAHLEELEVSENSYHRLSRRGGGKMILTVTKLYTGPEAVFNAIRYETGARMLKEVSK
jgi:hypothetical protein